MNVHNFPSKLLENAVNEFAKLPGVGRKTALRYVLWLLKQEKEDVFNFSDILSRLHTEIIHCARCHNITDKEICDICANDSRDHGTLCIVENIKDVLTIENTRQYNGLYHVLGGIISPMDGIGPGDLNVSSLEERVKQGMVKELIFALSTTMEGDTTTFYLYRKLSPFSVKITTLAKGVAIGDELEYADEITLGRSIINRIPFEMGAK